MKKIFSVVLSVLFLLTGFAFAEPKEKIAVAANGETLAASVGGQTGRSPGAALIFFFLMIRAR